MFEAKQCNEAIHSPQSILQVMQPSPTVPCSSEFALCETLYSTNHSIQYDIQCPLDNLHLQHTAPTIGLALSSPLQ